MLGLSLALFFIPILGSIIGGFVGGYKLGVVRKAVVAAIAPSMLVATGLWLLLTAFGIPSFGLFSGLALGLVVALADLGVIAGAILGAISGEGPDLPMARIERNQVGW